MFLNKKNTAYFISGSIVPLKDIGGGSVVIYRHLKELNENGYHIVFINCNANNKNILSEFEQYNLQKKIWHPPLRKVTPWLTSLRFHIAYRTIKKHFSFKPGDKIISLLEDQGCLLGYTLSKYFKIPFYLFFHDNNIFSIYFRSHIFHQIHINKIIKACNAFFVVSEPMRKLLLEKGAKNVHLIYPIPHGTAQLKKIEQVNFNALSFCYAGMILPFHNDLIRKIYTGVKDTNAELILISNFNQLAHQSFEDCPKIILEQKIPALESLFDYLIDKIDVLLIFYSFNMELEVRAEHSFPSKFIEFIHLGIPILIIAPPASAIGKWAIENSWLSYLATDDADELIKMTEKFKNSSFWKACSDQCLFFAKTIFTPEIINKKFLAIING